MALTSGKFVVQEITLWDPETNIIFYKANTEEDSKVLHVYGIKAVQGEKPYCLTCDVSYKGNISICLTLFTIYIHSHSPYYTSIQNPTHQLTIIFILKFM